jgi:hypothetical protein
MPLEPDSFIALGADPDLHATSIVRIWWHPTKGFQGVQGAFVLRLPKEFKGREAAATMARQVAGERHALDGARVSAFESQQVYAGKGCRADDLICLAHVTGALVASYGSAETVVYLPKPAEWKGQVPKRIHQARVLGRLGIPYEARGSTSDGYCVPKAHFQQPSIKVADFKHVVDALALAVYAAERYVRDTR